MAAAVAQPARVSHLVLLNAIGLPAPATTRAPATLAARYFRGVYQGMRTAGLRHAAARVGAALLARLARVAPVGRDDVRRRMALQGPPADASNEEDQEDQEDQAAAAAVVPSLGAAARTLRSLRLLVDLWQWQHAVAPRDAVFEGVLRAWNPFADAAALVAGCGATPRPVLLLWGDRDPLVPVAAMARFCTLLPGVVAAKSHPACDHNLPLQRPAFVIRELLDFFTAHPVSDHRVTGYG